MILPRPLRLSFSKLPSLWTYLKVSVAAPVNMDITDIEFKSAIVQSLQIHHGKVGTLSHVDVLKITTMSKCRNDFYTCDVILRVARQHKQLVWSALTLINTLQGSRCSMNVVKESPVLVALLPSQTSPSGGHSRYRHLPHVFWDMTSSWHHHHQPSLWRHNTWEERERGTLAKCYYRRDIKRLERSFVLTFVCISLNFVMLKPAIIYCGWHMYFFCRTGFVWWSA